MVQNHFCMLIISSCLCFECHINLVSITKLFEEISVDIMSILLLFNWWDLILISHKYKLYAEFLFQCKQVIHKFLWNHCVLINKYSFEISKCTICSLLEKQL